MKPRRNRSRRWTIFELTIPMQRQLLRRINLSSFCAVRNRPTHPRFSINLNVQAEEPSTLLRGFATAQSDRIPLSRGRVDGSLYRPFPADNAQPHSRDQVGLPFRVRLALCPSGLRENTRSRAAYGS